MFAQHATHRDDNRQSARSSLYDFLTTANGATAKDAKAWGANSERRQFRTAPIPNGANPERREIPDDENGALFAVGGCGLWDWRAPGLAPFGIQRL